MKSKQMNAPLTFENQSFLLDVSNEASIARRKDLERKIINNGGNVTSLSGKCDFIVSDKLKKICDSALKIPVVCVDYIDACLNVGRLLDAKSFHVRNFEDYKQFQIGKIIIPEKTDFELDEDYYHIPLQPFTDDLLDGFEIAKFSLFKDDKDFDRLRVVELHVSKCEKTKPTDIKCGVVQHFAQLEHLNCGKLGNKVIQFVNGCQAGIELYENIYNKYLNDDSMVRQMSFVHPLLGTASFQRLHGIWNMTAPELHPEVVKFLDHIWNEAHGLLISVLSVPVWEITISNLDEAEGMLLEISTALKRPDDLSAAIKTSSDKFYDLIPHLSRIRLDALKSVVDKHQLCQLIRDLITIDETTGHNRRDGTLLNHVALYRALQCHIDHVDPSEASFDNVFDLVIHSQHRNDKILIDNVFAIHRNIEHQQFSRNVDNHRQLFHSSAVSNFVGILSRGLLLPKVLEEEFGGQRTDVGMLGAGIYFSPSSSTCIEYSKPSKTKGTRMLLVNTVALGKVFKKCEFDTSLTTVPNGYDSIQGVMSDPDQPSDFKDDEFVIYNQQQQRVDFVVEFHIAHDNPVQQYDIVLIDEPKLSRSRIPTRDVLIDDVSNVKNPMDKVIAGLQMKDNVQIPLTSVHVRAKIVDMIAKVVVFQSYHNDSSKPIEAKYVFPLDDSAAVCGFEAFIDDKHVVGEVKEKEVAHKEYKKAISKGHGAYLIDEETPEVFKVSVGNLPADSTVRIKITYVCELTTDSDKLIFSIPGSVAPWDVETALLQQTQSSVKAVAIKESDHKLVFQASIEMASLIVNVFSPSHEIKTKLTDTKAVVSTPDAGIVFDSGGFKLFIEVNNIHVPRMWVENHPDNNTQACMLTFYPQFEYRPIEHPYVVFVIDASNSMSDETFEQASKVAHLCFMLLATDYYFNVIVFGSVFYELFPKPKKVCDETVAEAKNFLSNVNPEMGNTDVYQVLRSIALTGGSAKDNLNVFMITDGFMNNVQTVSQYLRSNVDIFRIFTLGVGSAVNKHCLSLIARNGGGSFEYYDKSFKSKWHPKATRQLKYCSQPGLNNVRLEWQEFDYDRRSILQAPRHIGCLFNESHRVIYGLIPTGLEVFMAFLKANSGNYEFGTMVSLAASCVTSGKLLHTVAARAVIRDWEDGLLAEDVAKQLVSKNSSTSDIVNLSKEYSVLTSMTSFIAVEERGEKRGAKKGPTIDELLRDEDVDILPYMQWMELERQDVVEVLEERVSLMGDEPSANDITTFERDTERKRRRLIVKDSDSSEDGSDVESMADGSCDDDDMGMGLFDVCGYSAVATRDAGEKKMKKAAAARPPPPPRLYGTTGASRSRDREPIPGDRSTVMRSRCYQGVQLAKERYKDDANSSDESDDEDSCRGRTSIQSASFPRLQHQIPHAVGSRFGFSQSTKQMAVGSGFGFSQPMKQVAAGFEPTKSRFGFGAANASPFTSLASRHERPSGSLSGSTTFGSGFGFSQPLFGSTKQMAAGSEPMRSRFDFGAAISFGEYAKYPFSSGSLLFGSGGEAAVVPPPPSFEEGSESIRENEDELSSSKEDISKEKAYRGRVPKRFSTVAFCSTIVKIIEKKLVDFPDVRSVFAENGLRVSLMKGTKKHRKSDETFAIRWSQEENIAFLDANLENFGVFPDWLSVKQTMIVDRLKTAGSYTLGRKANDDIMKLVNLMAMVVRVLFENVPELQRRLVSPRRQHHDVDDLLETIAVHLLTDRHRSDSPRIILKALLTIEQIRRKHCLACFTLELADNWESFVLDVVSSL